jgi:endonuclease YncB( thermonuclease family)
MTETAKDGRESVALWMIRHGYATGHGDTVEDMLGELEAQAKTRGISQYLGTRP